MYKTRPVIQGVMAVVLGQASPPRGKRSLLKARERKQGHKHGVKSAFVSLHVSTSAELGLN